MASGVTLDVVHTGEACRRFGPPPSLRSATAVLIAIRGKGVDRMPPQVADCPRNALQNDGRGLRRLAKSRQPRVRRGADWAPHTAWLLAGDMASRATLNAIAVRSEVYRRSCASCDRGLLESRSPRRAAFADRKWRWPRGCPNRAPQVRTAVVDAQKAQFRTEATRAWKRRTKYDTGNYHQRKKDGASRRRRKRTSYARS